MGIKKLNKFLTEKNCFNQSRNLDVYLNNSRRRPERIELVLAVDVWLYAHKFQYSHNNILVGFWNQVTKLLSSGVLPVYVFDGKPPDEKGDIVKSRADKKQKLRDRIAELEAQTSDISEEERKELEKQINKLNKQIIYISKNDIDLLKYFFDLMHVPYLQAKNEADGLCAKLYKHSLVDACLSDDMDILPSGCYKLLKIVSGQIVEFDLHTILYNLDITFHQFVDMCILFGCDYVRPIPKLTPDLAYRLIQDYENLECIIDEYLDPEIDKHQRFIDNYAQARELFLTAGDDEEIPDNLVLGISQAISVNDVVSFINLNCDMDTYKIEGSLFFINRLISSGVFKPLEKEEHFI